MILVRVTINDLRRVNSSRGFTRLVLRLSGLRLACTVWGCRVCGWGVFGADRL